jgi:hypothetical protein
VKKIDWPTVGAAMPLVALASYYLWSYPSWATVFWVIGSAAFGSYAVYMFGALFPIIGRYIKSPFEK